MRVALVGKIPFWCCPVQVFHPALPLQAFENGNPSAAIIAVDLAVAVLHSAAGSIEHPLGANRHRTDTAGIVQAAVTAKGAALLKLSKTSNVSEELGV